MAKRKANDLEKGTLTGNPRRSSRRGSKLSGAKEEDKEDVQLAKPAKNSTLKRRAGPKQELDEDTGEEQKAQQLVKSETNGVEEEEDEKLDDNVKQKPVSLKFTATSG